ncbi:MAG: hypothetical protein K5790_03670 [Nitrosopumilus sp.]|uniref:hypothetical protein n=1 Tax=Nitrosopumilus sp. TaxID=2024843 RepID=UPI00247C6172|nr:hypothetical protein [Nitrosopumilus sp.]MCV0392378.1 hypothetical protein [Nitrosopumilus sp.]
MGDCVQTWRKKIKLQELTEIAKQELKTENDINQVYKKLDLEMQIRWRFVSSTRKQYIEDIKKILANQYVLVI